MNRTVTYITVIIILLNSAGLCFGTIENTKTTAQSTENRASLDAHFGSSVNGLRMRISIVKTKFQRWESIDAKLVFQNVGDETLVILPGDLTFKVDGPDARYNGYPGRRSRFFGKVQVLEPGQLGILELVGLNDGGGKWILPEGVHCINASYGVKSSEWRTPVPPGRVWTGKVEAPAFEVTVIPNTPMHATLLELFEPVLYTGGKEKVQSQIENLGDEADDQLLLMLRDRGFEKGRRAIIWSLGIRKVYEAVPDLVALLGVSRHDIYETYELIEALGRIGDKRAFEALVKMLDGVERFDERRPKTLKALRQIGDDRAIVIFRKYTDSEEWKTAGQALAGLQILANEDVVSGLIDDVCDEQTTTREQSHLRLKGMEEAAALKLLDIYNTSSDAKRIAETGTFLELILISGHYESVIVNAALGKLESKDAAIRELAPYVLRSAKPSDEIIKALIAALKDTDDGVRDEAAGVLGEFGDRRAVEPLLEMARDHSRKSDEEAIGPLLLNFKDPEIDAALIAEFDKAGRNFRIRLASCVGNLAAHHKATPVAVQWLETIASDDSLEGISRVAKHDLQRMKDGTYKE